MSSARRSVSGERMDRALSGLAAFDLDHQLGRALGQLPHGAVEGRAIEGATTSESRLANLSATGAAFVDGAAGRRQVQKRLPQAARLAPAGTNLRCSSWATARETLVLCMWVWAPTALPVMTPYWPSVTSTRHSGIPIPGSAGHRRARAWETRLESTLSLWGNSRAGAGRSRRVLNWRGAIMDRTGIHHGVGPRCSGRRAPRTAARKLRRQHGRIFPRARNGDGRRVSGASWASNIGERVTG